MKPESPLSKLPSLGELIQHPTVQSVVERVNQTTLAQRATGFLEELQASWKEPGNLPSFGELAERLAHRLLGSADHCAPIVNATGVVCSQNWQAPLADPAVRELLRFASDYQRPHEDLMNRVSSSLAKVTGAEAAWIASSYAAALSLISQSAEATVVSCPVMGLSDPADFGYQHVETIGNRIENGAELVVVDGSGLLGGPRCGIVVGQQSVIEQLRQNELHQVLSADAMLLAALESTLEIYRTPEQIAHQIPVLQLLSAPLGNLEQRCHRIAPLLAECEVIASAEPVAVESVWLDAGDSQFTASSWAIALQPSAGTVDQLAEQFKKANPIVIGRVADEVLYLDFRAIFPRWDQHLIAVIE